MTNYDQLFQQQMKDPQFAQAYYDARIERLFDEMLMTLKEKIFHDEPKENLLKIIDSLQQQIHATRKSVASKTSHKAIAVS